MAICMLVAAFSIPCAANPSKEVSQHIAEQRQVAGPGNYSLDLTEQERKDLSKRAIAGDSVSAWRLFVYFEAFAFDWPDAIYWKQIAAENGGAREQYGFGVFLIGYADIPGSEGVPADVARRRGRYWICKAAQQGLSYAQSEILDIEKKTIKFKLLARLTNIELCMGHASIFAPLCVFFSASFSGRILF